MQHAFSRTELLIGERGLQILKNSKVAVFGVGGVGSYAIEALCRAGVGHFALIDDDRICLTNLNRQLHATRKTVGKLKVDAMKERMLDINPDVDVETFARFYLPGQTDDLISADWDYIVDAVDTVAAKIDLVLQAQARGIPIISSMGAGNKLDPARFEVADVYKTSVDPLAKVMRRELRKRGVKRLKVVFSKEEPIRIGDAGLAACKVGCVCPPGVQRTCTKRRSVPGSISFVPSAVGLIIAAEVVKDLLAKST